MSVFDNAISAGVKLALNHMLHGVGRLTQFHLDLKGRSVSGTVALEGEVSEVDFSVGAYELSRQGEDVFVRLKEITCSRVWLQTLVQRLEPEPVVKLPEKMAHAVTFAGMV